MTEQTSGGVQAARLSVLAHRGHEGWASRTASRPDGLPRTWVVLWFPSLLVLLFVLAVVLEISGTSSGAWWRAFGDGADPNLLAGTPRPIRSDEWLVQGSWLVSQTAQGFPPVNHVFPGGMDATVMNDAPAWDWSTVFRPQMWGSLVFGVDHGMAWRWWLPALFLLSSVHAFVVTMLPTRALLGPVLALVVMFQPLVQWWWMPIMTLAVSFAFVTMAAIVWGQRSATRTGVVVPAAVAAYTAVMLGMSIYLPFILAVTYPTAAFAVGFLLCRWRIDHVAGKDVLLRLVPLAVGGTLAASVLAVWVWTRRETVQALLDTVYPGQRLTPTGAADTDYLVGLLSGPFQRALLGGGFEGLGTNESTASVPFLVGLYLMVPLLWVGWTRYRDGRVVDWLVISLAAVNVLVLVFLFVPGWDDLARVLLLDRTQFVRLRAAYLPLLVVSIVVLVERLEGLGRRSPWWVALASGAVVVASTGWVWQRLDAAAAPAVGSAVAVAVLVPLTVAVVAFARRFVAIGAAALLVATLAVGAGVNPWYRGVFDLRTDTAAGRAVVETAEKDPQGTWVGVGTPASMGMVFEAGVPGYSGVQTYPSRVMWDRIDPQGRYEDVWNRLAHVQWVWGPGPSIPVTPRPDVVRVTLDPCNAFAQRWVDYVVTDGKPPSRRCLEPLGSYEQGQIRHDIYRIVPAAGA
ncbi:hypothetical protein KV102_04500 [Mumia sp. zg.B53]|uniref:DUF7657 domain-containing protein n=1 Tax=Mumia sp. zg.B53 TaxID=2855449 RepID=UPI001C6F3095|nr:hypothetical protein [Mumia sp. zg.B53]MBW9214094.1 hypothetical protein [Mumia sp. zg.B53]